MPISETRLIERIALASAAARPALRRSAPARIVESIGDDCAILSTAPGTETLVTTDFSLEGMHFRREWHPADAVGHRCLTRGLSDIAAMGGTPFSAFLSLALPSDLSQRWADQFFDGFLNTARSAGVTLAGGDIAESPSGVLADITVIGTVAEGKAIRRGTAKPGDRIFVTGELGAPYALLEQMYASPDRRFRASSYPAHFYPQAQLAVARFLGDKQIPSAMIDISDGLSLDLARLCRASGVGAILQENAIPIASLNRHEVELRHALHGGDEYQLLFTVSPGRRLPSEYKDVPLSLIGYITEGNEISIEHENGYTTELEPKGWQYFTPPSKRKRR
ncbi:MAG TPA: thiamine-phosphate kinase [Candidatus Saccharimonadales bacterium]|nr:thiamine-phosphate kinase [Candidatus Saccharimonadales bacterium]